MDESSDSRRAVGKAFSISCPSLANLSKILPRHSSHNTRHETTGCQVLKWPALERKTRAQASGLALQMSFNYTYSQNCDRSPREIQKPRKRERQRHDYCLFPSGRKEEEKGREGGRKRKE